MSTRLCYLQFMMGGEEIENIQMNKDVFSIGREQGDLIIDDPEISITHCQIHKIQNEFHLFDLNSTNGTFLNEHRVLKAKLQHKDVVRIGRIVFQVFIENNGQEFDFSFLSSDMLPVPPHPLASAIDAFLQKAQQEWQQKVVLKAHVQYFDHTQEIYTLPPGEWVVGRLTALGKFPEDQEMSRKHAKFYVDGTGCVYVEDLKSTNGVFVNQEKIFQPKRLQPEDKVKVGQCLIQVERVS